MESTTDTQLSDGDSFSSVQKSLVVGGGISLTGVAMAAGHSVVESDPGVFLVAESTRMLFASSLLSQAGRMLARPGVEKVLGAVTKELGSILLHTSSSELLLYAGGTLIGVGVVVGSVVYLVDRFIHRKRTNLALDKAD
ncbi:hypothetical protein JW766_03795 [Candidatus Dojkabacteria bacterium]|nr:hypothetical protein [Candidatus Dojkabacteria bacterium]